MTQAALEFDRVSYTYPGGQQALRAVSLRGEAGERLGVLGPNGGGKSTLLKIALGLLTPDEGEVRVWGMSPRQARREGVVGYLAQRMEAALDFPLSARQTVEVGAARRLAPWRAVPRAMRERVDRAIELVGAAAYADRPVGRLSGGQLQRVLIARAVACEPKILALDEPTVGVDAEGQRRFGALLSTLHRELGLTILLVSHDIRSVAAGCDRVACLARTLHFHDAPGGLTPQVLAEVFSHEVAAAFGGEVHVDAHSAHDCPGDHAHPHEGAHGKGGGCAHD